MHAIPYDSPQEDWDRYEEGETDEPLPGRPRRQFFNRRSAALFAVVVGAVCFYAGVRVEKSQLSSSTSTAVPSSTGAATRTGAAGAGSRAGAAAASAGRGFGGGGGAVAAFAGAGGGAGGSASFGTVSGVSGDTFYVTESSGNTVKVKLSSATKITKSVGVGKSAVRPGDTVVIRGLNSNGTVSATSISDSGAVLSAFGGGSSGSGSSGGGGSGTGGAGSASSAVSSLFGSGSGG
ncbi:MAG: hypothetical protein JOY58_05830 [Solirubrobacterales bacterium]|nr:hypothetical protein [Solirubrobacterales bacterium]